jgi:hypothetical protein
MMRACTRMTCKAIAENSLQRVLANFLLLLDPPLL